MPKRESRPFEWIKDWWFLIAFVALVIMAWANLKTSVDANTNDIAGLKSHYEVIEAQQNTENAQLSVISTDIKWIKCTLAGTCGLK